MNIIGVNKNIVKYLLFLVLINKNEKNNVINIPKE